MQVVSGYGYPLLSAGVDPSISQHVCLKETACTGYLVKLGGELTGKGDRAGISATVDEVIVLCYPICDCWHPSL